MGGCFSKKAVSSSVVTNAASPSPPGKSVSVEAKQEVLLPREDESSGKKEVFVIKHRSSHESGSNSREKQSSSSPEVSESDNGKVEAVSTTTSMAVRTSSCTKEEVEAILIQCGRLSRNNSFGTPSEAAGGGGGGGGSTVGRRYSGSKRSFDFDEQNERGREEEEEGGGDGVRDSRRQHRHSRSSRNSSPAASQGRRRRTPSREADQRSGSRERGTTTGNGNGRRVSISPGRRSENTTAAAAAPPAAANGGNSNNVHPNNRQQQPGKMVSVPPTVGSSSSSNKTNNNTNNGGEAQPTVVNGGGGVKRISVKRNAGETGLRSAAASPRARSPARGVRSDANQQQQQPSLSRNSSRKAEQSPKRRNALAEIDPSSLAYPQANVNKMVQDNNGTQMAAKETSQKPNPESLKQQSLSRSRSARRSRDLDINVEALLNPQQPTSYTSLLLEDIHNFHQKKNNNDNNGGSNPPPPSSFQLPACVTKACSIMEAVADLNSTTSSNLSSTLSEDHHRRVLRQEAKNGHPFVVESEVVTMDDLMEPSFHKYVTVRRGGSSSTCGGEDMDNRQEESSGSNSFVGGGTSQQQQGNSYSSGWEPNSADSTDRWSNNNGKEEEKKMNPSPVPAPLGLGIGQRVHGLSDRAGSREIERVMEEARMGFSGKENGIGKGKLGNRSHHLLTTAVTTAVAFT